MIARRAVPALLALVAVLALATTGFAQPATTEPGVLYPVKVTITDTSIKVAHARYPRGAIIQYHIRNLGKKRHAFIVGATARSRTIEPGGKALLLVGFDTRGRFKFGSPLKADRKVAKMRGVIVVY
jgi:hypothetical protein